MSIREVIAVVNQMEADGVIDRYAIGGAVGATFYLEPVATLDVDVFVAFHPEPGELLASPKPILDYLASRGCSMKREYVMIAGWPVQFLPPTGPLIEEALAEATKADVEGLPARVFRAEHLAAIALQTGRQRTKRACCSSSRKAHSTRSASRTSSNATISLMPGRDLNDNSSPTHHDLATPANPRKQACTPARAGCAADCPEIADAGCNAGAGSDDSREWALARPSAASCSIRLTSTPRLPPGSSTRRGCKTNVLFFDRKTTAEKAAWTESRQRMIEESSRALIVEGSFRCYGEGAPRTAKCSPRAIRRPDRRTVHSNVVAVAGKRGF